MKNKCETIRDLLPLYMNNIISLDIRSMANEHLMECEECRRIYKNYSTVKNEEKDSERIDTSVIDNNIEVTEYVVKKHNPESVTGDVEEKNSKIRKNSEKNAKVEEKKREKYSRKVAVREPKVKNKSRKTKITLIIVISLVLALSVASYTQLSTPNFIRAGLGLIKLMTTDVEYVQIQSEPRIIVTKSENAGQQFVKVVGFEGYAYVEQLGTRVIIEKNGHKEYVDFYTNDRFTRWIWEKDKV